MTVERRADPSSVRRILSALPAWFGDPDALEEYVVRAGQLPSYLAAEDGRVAGIALVERHFPESAELALIAVDPGGHRSGIGSDLLAAIEDDLRADGCLVLQVHTVGPSYPSPAYALTRAFYQARGFVPLFERVGLDWAGPTLVLVKSLVGIGPQRSAS